MALMSVFTFDDLIEEIAVAHKSATSPEIRMHWARLSDLVSEVAGDTNASQLNPSLDTEPWWLVRAEISGFRGVPPDGLTVDFPGSPGLTIVHGPNGSGKSSVCHAVDVGLHQDMSGSVERWKGTGGQHPVWEPVVLNSAGTNSRVELTLKNADGRSLSMVTTTNGGDAVNATATLTHADGSTQPADIGHEWRSAVAAYGPTYAYATWEQHIQRAQDLQRYLERMLVLGGCFGAVERTISARADRANRAKSRIDSAQTTATAELASLAKSSGREWTTELPSMTQDPDEWWLAAGLPHPSAATNSTPATISIDALDSAAQEVREALTSLNAASTGDPNVANALRLLDQADLESTECPVCGTTVAWKDHLHLTVEGSKAAETHLGKWAASVDRLVREAEAALPDLCKAGSPTSTSDLDAALSESRALRLCMITDGATAKEAVNLAACIVARIASSTFKEEAHQAVERCSEEAAWQNSVATALEPLAATIRNDRDEALASVAWAEVASRLDVLEKRLKARRQQSLEEATNDAVSALLNDAGVTVDGLTVQKRQANMILKDPSGKQMELGMLSAGQRNAVLLAPALAVAEGGPFGFLLVDDPVHSFDELRVDYVAHQLARIAKHRRVVVFTHDERLREHLLASTVDIDSRVIRRIPKSGRIDVTEVPAMWQVLLDDATNLAAVANPPQLALGLTNTLRGLCRQAIDNALRLFVTRESLRSAADASTWLAQLDARGVGTTEDRFTAVGRLPLNSAAQARLASCRSTIPSHTFQDWNRAAHGNPVSTPFSSDELSTARAACKELFK